jgi:glyoxylase-like metal-dependent hydrolase (beta-lactamase superfamily II)
VDVFPTPGHNETEVSFYDRNTALFFSGDFLMPGRLLIDDAQADLESANRAAAFVATRPVTNVLGGHIEENAIGELFPWQTSFHPREHVLQMTKADILALPEAAAQFNGLYSHVGQFYLMNSMRLLYLFAGGLLAVVIALIVVIAMFFRRRRRRTERSLA